MTHRLAEDLDGVLREMQFDSNDDNRTASTSLLSPSLTQPAPAQQVQSLDLHPLSAMDQEQMSNLFHGATRFNVHGGQFNSMAGNIVVNSGGHKSSGIACADLALTENAKVLPSQMLDSGSSGSMNVSPWTMSYSTSTREEKDSETYARLLWHKGRGFPLWYPKPNMNLPSEYLKKGVRIGDVGIITSNGDFDFLFNICLPSHHPINGNRVPAVFRPIDSPDPMDISSDVEHAPGTYIMSKLIQGQTGPGTLSPIGSSNEFHFQCANHEGAILILPEGYFREDLQNLTTFRQYASRNGEAWYQYANGSRGREATNGSLHLVTGYDKGTSWVVAAFSHGQQARRETSLQFNANLVEGDPNSANYSYYWNQSGPARVKYGPIPVPGDNNQCVFLRTFSITLNTGIWAKLFGTGLAQVTKSIDMKVDDVFSRKDLASPGSEQNGKTPSEEPQPHEQFMGSSVMVTPNFPAPSHTDHPARSINAYLLDKTPAAKMAISHDENWCAVLSDAEDEIPGISELLHRIDHAYDIVCQDGAVSLSSKEEAYSALRTEPVVQEKQNADLEKNEIIGPRRQSDVEAASENIPDTRLESLGATSDDMPSPYMPSNLLGKGHELVLPKSMEDIENSELTNAGSGSLLSPPELEDTQDTRLDSLINVADWINVQGSRRPPAISRRPHHGRTRDPQRVRVGTESPELNATSRRSRSPSWHSISHTWNINSPARTESLQSLNPSFEDVHRVRSEYDISGAIPRSGDDSERAARFYNASWTEEEKTRREGIEKEQRRQDEIRDGYMKLKDVLPGNLYVKSSKVSLLERAVAHIIMLENENKSMQQRLYMLEKGIQRLRTLNEKAVTKENSEK